MVRLLVFLPYPVDDCEGKTFHALHIRKCGATKGVALNSSPLNGARRTLCNIRPMNYSEGVGNGCEARWEEVFPADRVHTLHHINLDTDYSSTISTGTGYE